MRRVEHPGPLLEPALAAYVARVLRETGRIPRERRDRLELLAGFVRSRVDASEPAPLVFICTHNSRRSHMAQLWAQVAARRFGIDGVATYSGGTEATAFDRRAVAALERAGFAIEAISEGDNPVYAIHFSEFAEPLQCFSKVYDQPPNPTAGFCAVMTCGAADAGCPVVLGAARRIAITYDDPKAADETPEETVVYDARCRQIAREMLYAFSRVSDV